jgi:excisionase family DNA binding protein
VSLLKKLLRYDEASQVLSCSRDHIGRMVDAGKLTRVYLGEGRRGARITVESIDRYIEGLKQRNGSQVHQP